MTAAKLETAAEKYKRIRAEQASKEQLFDVTCECGMTWKARKFKIDFWVTSGILPMHLVEKLVKATGGKTETASNLLRSMATEEIVKSIVFSAKVVRHTAVDPAIKEKPEGPNDVDQEDVMTCCYTTLFKWQMGGGEEAAGLSNFPV